MKRIKQKFSRDLDWERQFGFDINTDYIALIEKYNHLIADRNREEIHKLLTEQGGLFTLSVKASYQKGMMKGEETIIVPE